MTSLEIVRTLLRILGKSEDLIEFVADRPGHDRRYALNSDKIRRELDWRPKVGLEQGLAQTVEWYRTHPEWVKKTKSGEYQVYYDRFYRDRSASLAKI